MGHPKQEKKLPDSVIDKPIPKNQAIDNDASIDKPNKKPARPSFFNSQKDNPINSEASDIPKHPTFKSSEK